MDLVAPYAGVILFLAILWVVLAILWTFLPFAVFGLKGLLREAIAQQRRTNELLATIANQGRAGASYDSDLKKDPTF